MLARLSAIGMLAALISISGGTAAAGGPPEAEASEADASCPLGFTMLRIDGVSQPLEVYRGSVVLIVNVASRCGLTPQYEGLERLYRSRHERGLVVLGFPANDFGQQEPGSDEEIAEFCRERFGVSFPMFSKISVKGESAHPLYRCLASQPDPIGGEPRWNFTKFLIDHEGRVVARFEPRTAPDDPALLSAVDALLERRGMVQRRRLAWW